MNNDFIEVKSTENQPVFLRKGAVGAFEVVPATAREPGHVKVYASGFKFLVRIEKDELLKKLSEGPSK